MNILEKYYEKLLEVHGWGFDKSFFGTTDVPMTTIKYPDVSLDMKKKIQEVDDWFTEENKKDPMKFNKPTPKPSPKPSSPYNPVKK